MIERTITSPNPDVFPGATKVRVGAILGEYPGAAGFLTAEIFCVDDNGLFVEGSTRRLSTAIPSNYRDAVDAYKNGTANTTQIDDLHDLIVNSDEAKALVI